MRTTNSWIRDLVLLTLLIGAFFAYNLGGRALWSPGEGRYAEIAREMIASGDYVTLRLAGMKFLEKPPLFIWFETLPLRYFGVSEWSLRLWPAILAVVGCLAVYVVGRNFFERKAGFMSAMVLATSGLWFGFGHIISLDMAVSVLLSCALFSFLFGVRAQPGPKRRTLIWGSFVFAAFATLTKGLIGMVLPGMIVGLWVALLNEWEILKSIYLPSSVLIFLLIAAPWHILVAQANPGFLDYFFIHGQFQRYLTSRNGPLHGPAAFIPVLVVGLFPWTVFLAQALKRNLRFPWQERHRHQETLFLVIWAAVVFLFFSLSRYQDIPYILPMFPPLAVLIGRYLALAWDVRDPAGNRFEFWILLSAIAIMAVVSLGAPQHYLERYSNWPSLNVPSEEGRIVSNKTKHFVEIAALDNYVYLQAAVLAAGAAIMLLLAKRRGPVWVLASAALTWGLFLVVVNNSLSLLDQRRSVKVLANVIKSDMKPGDEVAAYRNYYQDLPVYLQRPIRVVDWEGELQFGRTFSHSVSPWVIDDKTFWKNWDGPKTVFAITDRATFENLRVDAVRDLHVVAGTSYDIVLSNREIPQPSIAATGLRPGALASRRRPSSPGRG
jgi:4-amino-4-deoxy-L-arabinose transferase-like glycosyltransferase